MMSEQQSTEQPEGRPLGQRAIAGVLAIAMFVSGCGGAFNDSDASAQGGSVDPSATRLDVSQLKWTVSEATVEQGDADVPEAAVEPTEAGAAVMRKSVAASCRISHKVTVAGLSANHKRNIANHWTEDDPVRLGQKRPRTLDSRQPGMEHARHHHHRHRHQFLPGGREAHYSFKFNSIDHANAKASWTALVDLPIDSANCVRHTRKLNDVVAGRSTLADSDPEFPVISFLASSAFGFVIMGVTSAVLAWVPGPLNPLAAPIAGCLAGGVMGAMDTFMRHRPHQWEEYLAFSIRDCLFGVIGAMIAIPVRAAGIDVRARAVELAAAEAASAMQAVVANPARQVSGLGAVAVTRATQTNGPGAIVRHLDHALGEAANALRRRSAP